LSWAIASQPLSSPRWEKEFDEKRARLFGTPEEAELDSKSGDVAFADAARQGD